eukprot:jgi/Orpsp1_1/1181354/evm.model.c7180000076931.1
MNILVLGDKHTGKSSLISTFVNPKSAVICGNESYSPTIEDSILLQYIVNNGNIQTIPTNSYYTSINNQPTSFLIHNKTESLQEVLNNQAVLHDSVLDLESVLSEISSNMDGSSCDFSNFSIDTLNEISIDDALVNQSLYPDHSEKEKIFQTINLTITEVGGAEEFTLLIPSAIDKADAFIFVYDVGNEESFHHIWNYFKKVVEIKMERPKDIPMILVGSMVDTIVKNIKNSRSREVTTEQGRLFGNLTSIPFFESSAKAPKVVSSCFKKLISESQRIYMEYFENIYLKQQRKLLQQQELNEFARQYGYPVPTTSEEAAKTYTSMKRLSSYKGLKSLKPNPTSNININNTNNNNNNNINNSNINDSKINNNLNFNVNNNNNNNNNNTNLSTSTKTNPNLGVSIPIQSIHTSLSAQQQLLISSLQPQPVSLSSKHPSSNSLESSLSSNSTLTDENKNNTLSTINMMNNNNNSGNTLQNENITEKDTQDLFNTSNDDNSNNNKDKTVFNSPILNLSKSFSNINLNKPLPSRNNSSNSGHSSIISSSNSSNNSNQLLQTAIKNVTQQSSLDRNSSESSNQSNNSSSQNNINYNDQIMYLPQSITNTLNRTNTQNSFNINNLHPNKITLNNEKRHSKNLYPDTTTANLISALSAMTMGDSNLVSPQTKTETLAFLKNFIATQENELALANNNDHSNENGNDSQKTLNTVEKSDSLINDINNGNRSLISLVSQSYSDNCTNLCHKQNVRINKKHFSDSSSILSKQIRHIASLSDLELLKEKNLSQEQLLKEIYPNDSSPFKELKNLHNQLGEEGNEINQLTANNNHLKPTVVNPAFNIMPLSPALSNKTLSTHSSISSISSSPNNINNNNNNNIKRNSLLYNNMMKQQHYLQQNNLNAKPTYFHNLSNIIEDTEVNKTLNPLNTSNNISLIPNSFINPKDINSTPLNTTITSEDLINNYEQLLNLYNVQIKKLQLQILQQQKQMELSSMTDSPLLGQENLNLFISNNTLTPNLYNAVDPSVYTNSLGNNAMNCNGFSINNNLGVNSSLGLNNGYPTNSNLISTTLNNNLINNANINGLNFIPPSNVNYLQNINNFNYPNRVMNINTNSSTYYNNSPMINNGISNNLSTTTSSEVPPMANSFINNAHDRNEIFQKRQSLTMNQGNSKTNAFHSENFDTEIDPNSNIDPLLNLNGTTMKSEPTTTSNIKDQNINNAENLFLEVIKDFNENEIQDIVH